MQSLPARDAFKSKAPVGARSAVRGGGHRPVSLQHHGAAVGGGKVPGGGQAVGHWKGAAGQPSILPLVGGEDRGGRPSVQNIYMPGQGIYAIGVQHHRYLQVT